MAASAAPTGETGARTSGSIARDAIKLQFKLLLDALRDLTLSPLTLAAAALDILLARSQSPRYFDASLRLGQKTDHWINLWSATRHTRGERSGNVDDLLEHVEQVVLDPQGGARRARILKRWAERELRRAQRRQVERAPPG